ncbi:hypothetical protein K440DRAFT_255555 [Wilcoxina mikolae CBS 423.85]|nr:hypothetical protein K440DRAFT_308546 [Wilcoxina mikolae CBS 423.85]KAF8241469.1 hypothetical protein K440DRAFT_255555 [Wilcoxina mikolae CBS 423.85]
MYSVFFNSNYTQIVPDGQVLVSNHIDGVWPAIIIEVANSQTYNKVLAKMQLWFVTSQAVVRAVCIIRYPQDALVTSTVHVELWRCFSRSSDLVTTVCNNAGTVNTGIRYIPPPQEIDIAENFAAMQEALDQAKPGQLLFTYREGPIYVC